MVGLTGFSSPPFSGTTIADDQKVFDDFLQPGVSILRTLLNR